MNLGDLKDRCATLFRDPANTVVSEPTWVDHINAAYMEFARSAKWPFLISEDTVTAPADDRTSPQLGLANFEGVIKGVYDETNDRSLLPVPEEFPHRERLLLEAQRSSPLFFEIIGDRLYIMPPSSSATVLRVYFFTSPTRLSSDADEPVIPDLYREALVVGALAQAHLHDQNPELAGQYREEFARIVQLAMQDLIETHVEAQP